MWVLNIERFWKAVESAEKVEKSRITREKERVIRLLMGDETFMEKQTLESIADIINQAAPMVFEEFENVLVIPSQLDRLENSPHRCRRRLL